MKPIQNFHPHSVTGKTDDSFVGLKIIGSQIHFYYPESYHFDMESKTICNDIIDFLRTIAIAKTGSKEESQAHNTTKTTGNVSAHEKSRIGARWRIL